MTAKRLTTALIFALIISGLFTFLLSKRVAKASRVSAPQKQLYVSTSTTLEAGDVLKPGMLEMVEWSSSTPLAGGFTKINDVVGRSVLYPLAKGEPILERQLSAAGAGVGLTASIPEGMRAISVRSDEVVGVAGFLLPGTHVDVLVTLRTSNNPEPITATVLQDAELLAAGQKTQPDPEGKATTATVVTILVKPEDAERVVLASTQGSVHFVLRNGLDRQEFTGLPAQLSQLSGEPDKPAKPVQGVHKQLEVVMTKPTYVVETILGSKQRTDNF